MLHCLNITDKPCKKIKTIIVKKKYWTDIFNKLYSITRISSINSVKNV